MTKAQSGQLPMIVVLGSAQKDQRFVSRVSYHLARHGCIRLCRNKPERRHASCCPGIPGKDIRSLLCLASAIIRISQANTEPPQKLQKICQKSPRQNNHLRKTSLTALPSRAKALKGQLPRQRAPASPRGLEKRLPKIGHLTRHGSCTK